MGASWPPQFKILSIPLLRYQLCGFVTVIRCLFLLSV